MIQPELIQPEQSIALFGGSFDPVHRGHLAVARAAAERFQLARVYFIPACLQPLKAQQEATSFYHCWSRPSVCRPQAKRPAIPWKPWRECARK